jgi:hypothetical protein
VHGDGGDCGMLTCQIELNSVGPTLFLTCLQQVHGGRDCKYEHSPVVSTVSNQCSAPCRNDATEFLCYEPQWVHLMPCLSPCQVHHHQEDQASEQGLSKGKALLFHA